jgi:SAM-dependent methyltransferase
LKSSRRFARAWTIYQEFGIRTLAQRASRRLLRVVGVQDARHTAWLSKKSKQDAEFDRVFATDTGGIQDIVDRDVVGDNAKYGLSHIASDPADFDAMIGSLRLPLSSYTFVDLGSGKGRAVILAARYAFAKVIGVEFVREFVETAHLNVAAARSQYLLHSEIELVLQDATAFDFPSGPVLLYLFNPFDSYVLKKVAQNALRSWLRVKRPFVVVYMNPIHVESFTTSGWQVVGQGPSWVQLACGG